jgi:Flp pilus assembly protein TadG
MCGIPLIQTETASDTSLARTESPEPTVSAQVFERARRCSRGPTRKRSDSGQAIVEFALVLPVLLLLVFGIIKMGTVYLHYISLTEAVRDGARQLSVERGQPSPCTDATTSFHSSAGSSLSGLADPAYSFSNGTDECSSGLVSNTSGTLAGSYPCDLSLMGINFAPGCTLRASTTVRIE